MSDLLYLIQNNLIKMSITLLNVFTRCIHFNQRKKSYTSNKNTTINYLNIEVEPVNNTSTKR